MFYQKICITLITLFFLSEVLSARLIKRSSLSKTDIPLNFELLQNLEKKAYQNIIDSDSSNISFLDKTLLEFYQTWSHFRLQNYEQASLKLAKLPKLLQTAFIDKILLDLKQDSANPNAFRFRYNKQDFIKIINLFPALFQNSDFINIALTKIDNIEPYWQKLHKQLWLLGEIKSSEINQAADFKNTNKEYLLHLANLYKNREYNYLIKQYAKVKNRFKNDKANYPQFLYQYSLVLRKKGQYSKALNILNDKRISDYKKANRLKLNILLNLNQETKAHNFINQIKKKADPKLVNQMRFDFGDYHFKNFEYKSSLYRFNKVDIRYLTRNEKDKMLWQQFFAALQTKNNKEVKYYLNLANKHNFYYSRFSSAVCFWGLKYNHLKVTVANTNPCFPKYFMNYYGWQGLNLKKVEPAITTKFESKKIDFLEKELVKKFLILYKLEDPRIVDIFVKYYFSKQKSKENFLKLAFLLNKAFRYRQLIELAVNNYSFSSVINDDDFFIHWLKAVYPLGYYKSIKPLSEKYGLDPLLLIALIREESHFNPEIESSAGALGLMQLMPATAKEVATRNKIDFSQESITDIPLNLKLGAIYLKRLLKYFDNNAVFALASYNGGIGNVRRWRKKNNKDLDHFIESITFPETRFYVKKVLRSYNIYKFIYAADIQN